MGESKMPSNLKEYYSNYKPVENALIRVTKKEVEDFDKKHNSQGKHLLLADKKWFYDNGVYYEVPTGHHIRSKGNCKCFGKLKNMSKGIKIACLAILGAGVVTAVAVPLTLHYTKSNIVVDESLNKAVNITSNTTDKDGNRVIVLRSNHVDRYVNIVIVEIDSHVLIYGKDKDYTFDISSQTVTIKKETLEKYNGVITLIPSLETLTKK